MQENKYSILRSDKTVYVTCVSPLEGCAVKKIFSTLENINYGRTVVAPLAIVHSLTLVGTPKEIRDGMPTVVDLISQVCDGCQLRKQRVQARELVKQR